MVEFSKTGTIDRLRARFAGPLRAYVSVRPIFSTCDGSNVLILISARDERESMDASVNNGVRHTASDCAIVVPFGIMSTALTEDPNRRRDNKQDHQQQCQQKSLGKCIAYGKQHELAEA